MPQLKIKCSIYRGGTSRGLFFLEKDLPEDRLLRDKIFLKGIGAEDASHINGLGGGTSHTSKVVIVEKSTNPNIDVNYTFVQLGIGDDTVDYAGTCGNLMAAVGAFAVDEGLVNVDTEAASIIIKVWSTNTAALIEIEVPLIAGEVKTSGDFCIPGVHDSGAKYIVDIMYPGGGKTGSTLPLTAQGEFVLTNGEKIAYSFADIVNPVVFISAEDLSFNGTELNSKVSQNEKVMQTLEEVRELTAVASGLCISREKARDEYRAIPKVGYVAKSQDYLTSTGKLIKKEDYHILARMVSMERMHRTFAMSALLNLGAMCLLKGTIPHALASSDPTKAAQVIRIGHPEGIAEVRICKMPDREDILYVGVERTVRKIMEGYLYIPRD